MRAATGGRVRRGEGMFASVIRRGVARRSSVGGVHEVD